MPMKVSLKLRSIVQKNTILSISHTAKQQDRKIRRTSFSMTFSSRSWSSSSIQLLLLLPAQQDYSELRSIAVHTLGSILQTARHTLKTKKL